MFWMLANYTRSVVLETSTTGLPAQRALFIHYPRDLQSYTIKYQYLLGRDLLVAPVYLEGVHNWTVFLPADQWIHLWSGRLLKGPLQVSVPAPVGQPPVFFRKSSRWKDTFKLISRVTIPQPTGAGVSHMIYIRFMLLCLFFNVVFL